jgi:hypothetical protein
LFFEFTPSSVARQRLLELSFGAAAILHDLENERKMSQINDERFQTSE